MFKVNFLIIDKPVRKPDRSSNSIPLESGTSLCIRVESGSFGNLATLEDSGETVEGCAVAVVPRIIINSLIQL